MFDGMMDEQVFLKNAGELHTIKSKKMDPPPTHKTSKKMKGTKLKGKKNYTHTYITHHDITKISLAHHRNRNRSVNNI